MTRYFLDVETSGLLRTHAQGYSLDAEPRIVSIAVVREDGSVVGAQRIRPDVSIPEAASRVHGIRDEDVAHAPPFAVVWPKLLAKVGDAALVCAHNAPFDGAVLAVELLRTGLPLPRWSWLDTLAASRRVIDHAPRHTLACLAEVLRLDVAPDHSALADARCAALLAAELDARDPAWCEAPMLWHPLPDGDVVMVTGHRHITSADVATVEREVAAEVAAGARRWVFGGAIGVDTVALLAAWGPSQHCTVIVPGTVAQQPAEARKVIEARADSVVEMCAANLSSSAPYMLRNAAMVHASSRVLAFTDGGPSGTRNAMEYARFQARPVRVVGVQGSDWRKR